VKFPRKGVDNKVEENEKQKETIKMGYLDVAKDPAPNRTAGLIKFLGFKDKNNDGIIKGTKENYKVEADLNYDGKIVEAELLYYLHFVVGANQKTLEEYPIALQDSQKILDLFMESGNFDQALDMAEGIEDKEEFMKSLMKNPAKIMDLVKNIGTKLEDKIKKGDLKESELLEEASNIMDKMKDIPGMKEMMSKMGMGGKIDFKAMSNKIQENLKKSKMKDRLNKKREQRAQTNVKTQTQTQSKDPVNMVQKTEDTFVVKVDDSVPLKSKKSKKKSKK